MAAAGAIDATVANATIDGTLDSKDALSLHAADDIAVGGSVVAEQGLALLAARTPAMSA